MAQKIIDITGTGWTGGSRLKEMDYLVVHHTGGRGTATSIVNVLKQRGYSIQYIVDRDGSVYQAMDTGGRAAQVGRKGRYEDAPPVYNSNSVGVEVIAKNDKDILPIQAEAVRWLAIDQLQIAPENIYGHGEINDYKQATEGQTIASYIRNVSAGGMSQSDALIALFGQGRPTNRALAAIDAATAPDAPYPAPRPAQRQAIPYPVERSTVADGTQEVPRPADYPGFRRAAPAEPRTALQQLQTFRDADRASMQSLQPQTIAVDPALDDWLHGRVTTIGDDPEPPEQTVQQIYERLGLAPASAQAPEVRLVAPSVTRDMLDPQPMAQTDPFAPAQERQRSTSPGSSPGPAGGPVPVNAVGVSAGFVLTPPVVRQSSLDPRPTANVDPLSAPIVIDGTSRRANRQVVIAGQSPDTIARNTAMPSGARPSIATPMQQQASTALERLTQATSVADLTFEQAMAEHRVMLGLENQSRLTNTPSPVLTFNPAYAEWERTVAAIPQPDYGFDPFAGPPPDLASAIPPPPPRTIVVQRPARDTSPITGPNYTISSGDTLSGIAQRSGLSVAQLAQINGIADPNRIRAGTTLRLTGPSQPLRITVSAGEAASSANPIRPLSGRNSRGQNASQQYEAANRGEFRTQSLGDGRIAGSNGYVYERQNDGTYRNVGRV